MAENKKKAQTKAKGQTTKKKQGNSSNLKKSSTPKKTVPAKKNTSSKNSEISKSKKTTFTKKSTPTSTKTSTPKVKIVPKQEIKTSLDKKIETAKEEPIKIITGPAKKGKQVQKKDKKEIKQKISQKWTAFIKTLKTKYKKIKKDVKKWQKNKKKIRQAKQKEQVKKGVIPTSKNKKLIFISLTCIFLAVLLMIPYGKRSYFSEASNKNLEMPKFLKLKEECCSYTATFSSLRSVWALKKDMENILKNYEVLNCDGNTYYYNENENYTITDYNIKQGILFNQILLNYGNGNSCDIDTKFKKLELLPSDFSLEDAIKDGNYVIKDNKVYNKEAYINFMDNVKNNIPSTLRIVTKNSNGAVLITDVEYTKEGKYVISYDGTRDQNNKDNKSIVAYIFEHLIISNHKLYAYNGEKLKVNGKKYETYYLLDIIEE